MEKISGIVITHNEEEKIGPCLQSLANFCSEIIVVDSGSTDNTVQIASKYADTVIETDWPGFGLQKNRALDAATNEWIVSLDADEVISESLKQEIEIRIASSEYDAYQLPRLTTYCGRFLHHGGWWPDYVTRVFRKSQYKFTDDKVHERVDTRSDKVGTFKEHILHYRADSLDDTLNRMNKYSTIWAQQNLHKKKGSIIKGLTHSFWTFIRIYVIRRGFLDGKEGFVMAVSNSCGSFFKYVKLYFLQKQKSEDNE
jgi:glycosyltransferase involved in cell wall biosynthesis